MTLEFLNQNAGDIFAPSVVHDGNGCQPGKNVVLAMPGGWNDACLLGVTGDWVFYVDYETCPTVACAVNCPQGDADGVIGLSLMSTGSALGFRALAEIRGAWPRLYGAGAAVVGAWAGILLVASAAILAVILGFWDDPGESSAQASLVATLLLLASDVALLVWCRHRFLERCRAE